MSEYKWWRVYTASGRMFSVKGVMFEGEARREAERRLEPGDYIVGWQDTGAVSTAPAPDYLSRSRRRSAGRRY